MEVFLGAFDFIRRAYKAQTSASGAIASAFFFVLARARLAVSLRDASGVLRAPSELYLHSVSNRQARGAQGRCGTTEEASEGAVVLHE